MWRILEHRQVHKVLRRAPEQVQVNFVAWKRVVEMEGPKGLRWIKGFHDEALRGRWQGFRSSRLNVQWRVIYRCEAETLTVYVVEVTPHRY